MKFSEKTERISRSTRVYRSRVCVCVKHHEQHRKNRVQKNNNSIVLIFARCHKINREKTMISICNNNQIKITMYIRNIRNEQNRKISK